jgi:methionyl-tRNA synthetase
LANGLGNLLSRLTTLAASVGLAGGPIDGHPDAPPGFHEHLAAYRFDEALAELWETVARSNREIAEVRPWEQIKRGDREEAAEKLAAWVDQLKNAAYWLEPFLPTTAVAVRAALEQPLIQKAGVLFPR